VEAGVALVGIDSVNIDDTRTGERPIHSILLAAGIPIVEHLCNLGQLAGRSFTFTATPPAVSGMGTFPVRALAVVE
jgi:kynurenine formamidase